jgi:hypothetical protein
MLRLAYTEVIGISVVVFYNQNAYICACISYSKNLTVRAGLMQDIMPVVGVKAAIAIP